TRGVFALLRHPQSLVFMRGPRYDSAVSYPIIPRRPMVERKLRLAPQIIKSSKTSLPKLFVLDTNVLMHDPTSLFRFEEHDLYLPIGTLEELDSNKKGLSDVARNARQASRFLDEIVSAQTENIKEGLPIKLKDGQHSRGRLFLQ